MLMLKGCPRCGGDLIIIEDKYFHYTDSEDKSYEISCLQCGVSKSVVIEDKKKETAS